MRANNTQKHPAPKKKVLCLFYDFPPSAMVGGKRAYSFYRYFSDRDWQPTVLTVPDTEYGLVDTTEQSFDAQDIIRVASREPRNFVKIAQKLRIMRVFWFFLYPFFWEKQAFWVRPLLRVAEKLHAQKKFDAVLTSSYPYATALVGYLLRRRLGIPWLCDLRDPYTLDSGQVWPSFFHFWIMRQFEKRWVNKADFITVVSPTMKDDLMRQFRHLKPEKIAVVYNGFAEKILQLKANIGDKGTFVINHTGTLWFREEIKRPGLFRCFFRLFFDYSTTAYDKTAMSPLELFQALQEIRKKRPDLFSKIKVKIVGVFDERNKKLAQQLGLQETVDFVGQQDHETAIRGIINANLLYLPMKRRLDGRPSAFMNTKTYEYLASGRPVIIIADKCDTSDLFQQAGCGFRVNYDDAVGLAEKIIEVMSGDYQSAVLKKDLVSKFTRRALAYEMTNLLDSLVIK